MAIEKVKPPFNPGLAQSTDRFSNLLDRFFEANLGMRPGNGDQFIPQVDVSETKTHFHYDVSLPGMKKEDINLNVDENVLTISGERSFEEKKEEGEYHMVENRYGSFTRSFSLPGNADAGEVEAKYDDGILRISVKKSKDQPGKEIKIS